MELIGLIGCLIFYIWLLKKTESEFGQGALGVLCLITIIAIITEIFR
jgi:hypothetical protein